MEYNLVYWLTISVDRWNKRWKRSKINRKREKLTQKEEDRKDSWFRKTTMDKARFVLSFLISSNLLFILFLILFLSLSYSLSCLINLDSKANQCTGYWSCRRLRIKYSFPSLIISIHHFFIFLCFYFSFFYSYLLFLKTHIISTGFGDVVFTGWRKIAIKWEKNFFLSLSLSFSFLFSKQSDAARGGKRWERRKASRMLKWYSGSNKW